MIEFIKFIIELTLLLAFIGLFMTVVMRFFEKINDKINPNVKHSFQIVSKSEYKKLKNKTTTRPIHEEKPKCNIETENINFDKIMTKKQLEEALYKMLDKETNEVYQNNPMKGTPMEGFAILEKINNITDIFKQRFEQDKAGLDEEEIKQLISKIYTRVYNKYLE